MTKKPPRRYKGNADSEPDRKFVKRGIVPAIAVFSFGAVRGFSRRCKNAKSHIGMADKQAAYINNMGTKNEGMHFDSKGRDHKN